MAHLWNLDASDDWVLTILENDEVTLVDRSLKSADDELFEAEAQLLLRRFGNRRDAWALVSNAHLETRVNGMRVMAGLTILADHDEIRTLGGPAWFFSTETQAHVEPFPGSEARGFCPRCKLTIAEGTPAVHCPACGLWYHQSEEYPCWTYAPQCAACPQPTELGAGFRWTPEEL